MWKGFREGEKMSKCGSDCRIDSVVTMNSKGQIVLPKSLREKSGFKPNGKIALMTFEKGGEICCILMINAEKLGDPVIKALGPMIEDIIK